MENANPSEMTIDPVTVSAMASALAGVKDIMAQYVY